MDNCILTMQNVICYSNIKSEFTMTEDDNSLAFVSCFIGFVKISICIVITIYDITPTFSDVTTYVISASGYLGNILFFLLFKFSFI